MADEYDVPAQIAAELWQDHIRMDPGDGMVWQLVALFAETSPVVTVLELRDALLLHCDRFAAGLDDFVCLADVPPPDAMQ